MSTAELDAIDDAIKEEGNQVSIKELFTTKKMLGKTWYRYGYTYFSTGNGY